MHCDCRVVKDRSFEPAKCARLRRDACQRMDLVLRCARPDLRRPVRKLILKPRERGANNVAFDEDGIAQIANEQADMTVWIASVGHNDSLSGPGWRDC